MKKKAVEYSLKAEKKEFPISKIRSAEDAVNFARKFYHDDINIYESSFILLMNQANNVTGYAKISQGGMCSILKSLDNAKTFCSYLDKDDLKYELEDMIERFINRVEKKISDNY